MILLKIFAIVFLGALIFIFRKWFLKHNYFLLAFIPLIVLILYAEFIFQFTDDKKYKEAVELNKWKVEHKDNFVTTDKIQPEHSAIKKLKVGDVLYDTTFNINSLKLYYKESIVSLTQDGYYDSSSIKIELAGKNNLVSETIYETTEGGCSPLDVKNPYNYLSRQGIFHDYNFDGYLDIAIRTGDTGSRSPLNGYFNIYLFNPESQRFIKYNEELINPFPNNDKKEVECEIIYSTATPSTETDYYKWVNGKLEITESVAYEQLDEQTQKDVIRTKETKTHYKNGVEISRTERIIKDKY